MGELDNRLPPRIGCWLSPGRQHRWFCQGLLHIWVIPSVGAEGNFPPDPDEMSELAAEGLNTGQVLLAAGSTGPWGAAVLGIRLGSTQPRRL